LGDSVTGPRPRERYLDKYLKYADLLQLLLEGHLGIGRAVVLNRGFAGDTTYAGSYEGQTPGAIARVQTDVLDEQPDIVTILLGGNDRQGAVEDRASTYTNLCAIVSAAQSCGAKVLLMQYHVLPNPECPELAWGHLDDNNPVIAEVAAACHVPLLDMSVPMRMAAETLAHDELVNHNDGVHLNPGGELVFARNIFSRLLALGWLESSTTTTEEQAACPC
jgi:lysophospholipase L1-like esterase